MIARFLIRPVMWWLVTRRRAERRRKNKVMAHVRQWRARGFTVTIHELNCRNSRIYFRFTLETGREITYQPDGRYSGEYHGGADGQFFKYMG